MQEDQISCKTLTEETVNQVLITPAEYNDILNIQQKILSMLATRKPSQTILEELCSLAERLLPNSVASIMMINSDTNLMSVLAAPSIPEVGHQALKDLAPGPGGGSCGNAVFRNEPQYVQNTFEDARWEDLRTTAIDFNLCSCWSMPVRDEHNNAIGTFALSSFEHRSPAPFHKKLLETAAYMVNIVLSNQEMQTELDDMAYKDSLTNLANKTQLEIYLKENIEQTLILLNVNNFSYINTAYGFDFGDKILIELAKIIDQDLCNEYTCRINSDEFALVFNSKIDINEVVNRIKNHFYEKEISIDNVTLNLSFSYGAAFGKHNLLRNAALALKQAKENGKNTLHIFNQDADSIDHSQREEFIKLNNLLHSALLDGRVVPFFQGIRDNVTGEIIKFESLARIKHNGEIISPYKFIEPARLAGVLPEITKAMIDKSFSAMQKNDYSFSLNITEEDLSRSYLVEYLDEKSKFYNINPQRVILEILEGVSATGKKNHIKQLNALKSMGFKIAIDDFGSEYSNFERVLDLEIDYLKIDARYIKNIDTDKKSYEITRAIVFFAKNAGIPCIAEFVHNETIQNIIIKLEIEYSQGFYFSEPTSSVAS